MLISTTANNDTNFGSKTAISLTIAERVLEKKETSSKLQQRKSSKESERGFIIIIV
jgi:ribosome assembly protein YihI (activator of Der GTPase)